MASLAPSRAASCPPVPVASADAPAAASPPCAPAPPDAPATPASLVAPAVPPAPEEPAAPAVAGDVPPHPAASASTVPSRTVEDLTTAFLGITNLARRQRVLIDLAPTRDASHGRRASRAGLTPRSAPDTVLSGSDTVFVLRPVRWASFHI